MKEVPENLCCKSTLVHLHTLDVSNNLLLALPETIDALVGLESLAASNNNITHIPKAIGGMTRLERIDLSHNQLSDLPFGQLLNMLDARLKYLDLYGNLRLKKPPPEVCDQGGTAVAHYLHNMAVNGQYDENTEMSLGFIGQTKAGKTTLIQALRSKDRSFAGEVKRTLGIDFDYWDLCPEEDLSFQILDFSGLAIYHPVEQLFLSRKDFVL